MKVILAAATVALAAAGGCAQERVVEDGSVASKFSAFNSAGWNVQGDGVTNANQTGPNGAKVIKPADFGNFQVITSSRLDDPNNRQVTPFSQGVGAPSRIPLSPPPAAAMQPVRPAPMPVMPADGGIP